MGVDEINSGTDRNPSSQNTIDKKVESTPGISNHSTLEGLSPDELRLCIKRLSVPDQISLSGANKFFYQFINEGLMHLTRVVPQEQTKLEVSVLTTLRKRFPAIDTLLITGALSSEKMVSLAEQWDTLTQGLKVEIEGRPVNLAIDSDTARVSMPLDSQSVVDSTVVSSMTNTLSKQTPGSGAALFQLLKNLSEIPAGHSPITKLDLSGIKLSVTKKDAQKLIETFQRACKNQHFKQLHVLNLSDINFEICNDSGVEQTEQPQQNQPALTLIPLAEYIVRARNPQNPITGGDLLEKFLEVFSGSELREIRATHIYLNNAVLRHLANALARKQLPKLEVLDLSQILNPHYLLETWTALSSFIFMLSLHPRKKLKELHLPPAVYSPIFSDDSEEALIDAFKKGNFQVLEILNINRPEKKAFNPYSQRIMANLDQCPHLQEIRSTGNYLRGDEFNIFCDHLENSLRKLKHLDLSHPYHTNVLDEPPPSLTRLINALAGNDAKAPSQIESLQLAGWFCTSEEVQTLQTTIDKSQLPKLERLSLPNLVAISQAQQNKLFSTLKAHEINFQIDELPPLEEPS